MDCWEGTLVPHTLSQALSQASVPKPGNIAGGWVSDTALDSASRKEFVHWVLHEAAGKKGIQKQASTFSLVLSGCSQQNRL
jgi:hypothetical protein